MRLNKKNITYLVGAAVLLLIVPGFTTAGDPLAAAADLIIQYEGFRANPYWDEKRYSWGYGTAAPGSTGTITREQARAELQQHIEQDYNYLQGLLTRSLTYNQWAALLSFSYNVGVYNADNLIANINSGNDAALFTQWMLYDVVGGRHSEAAAARRASEINVWIS